MSTVTLSSPTEQATRWLDDFGRALARGDIDATLALFDPDCYWRDLVAFTWNIRTQEGPAAIRAMLQARLAGSEATAAALSRADRLRRGSRPACRGSSTASSSPGWPWLASHGAGAGRGNRTGRRR